MVIKKYNCSQTEKNNENLSPNTLYKVCNQKIIMLSKKRSCVNPFVFPVLIFREYPNSKCPK